MNKLTPPTPPNGEEDQNIESDDITWTPEEEEEFVRICEEQKTKGKNG